MFGQKVELQFTFKCLITFFVCCCLEQYKLVSVWATGYKEARDSCRKNCSDYGMELMSLDSDNDRQQIVKLPEYRDYPLVITEGIEVVSSDSHYTYFSRPGGEKIYFIEDNAHTLYHADPGTYIIVLYSKLYTMEHRIPAGNSNTIFEFKCACKLPGERCSHDDLVTKEKRWLSRHWASSVSCHL